MRKIIQNLASVIGGEAMIRAANLVAALAIARLYGPATLGLYATCLAVVTAACMFADNGLQFSAVTELGANADKSSRIAGELYLSKTLLSALVLVLLFAVGVWANFPRAYWIIGGFVTFRTLIQSYSQLMVAMLKASFRMASIGIIQAIHAALLFLGVGIAFVRFWPLEALLTVLLAGQALELALMFAAVRGAGIHSCWPIASSCLALMRRSVPLGLGYALANLIVRLDVMVLSVIVPLSELGQFSAADNLLVLAYLSAWLLGSVLLPEMVKLSDSAGRLDRFLNRWIGIAFVVVVPGALLGFACAPRVVSALYGRDFAQAGTLASWMALACPFIVLNSLYLHHTIAVGAKRAYLRILFAAALLALALNYSLAVHFGATGVAAAVLIREILLSLVLWLRHLRARGPAVELRVSVPS